MRIFTDMRGGAGVVGSGDGASGIVVNFGPSSVAVQGGSGGSPGGGGARVAPLFFSEWNVAGTSGTAGVITDQGKYNDSTDSLHPENYSVLVSAGLPATCPTPNALQMVWPAAGNDGFLGVLTPFGVPTSGNSIFMRWYVAVIGNQNLSGSSNHFIQGLPTSSGGLPDSWENLMYTTTGPAFQMPLRYNQGTVKWRFEMNSALLAQSAFFRHEVQYQHQAAANMWNVHYRIYNSANVLIKTDADWTDQVGTGTLLSANPTIEIPDAEFGNCWAIAHNGVTPATDVLTYWAAVCIRNDDWCGAWNPTDH